MSVIGWRAPAAASPAAPRPPGRPRWLLRRGLSRSGGLLVLLVALVVVMLASVRLGSVRLDTDAVIGAFANFDGSEAHLIVRSLRVPRTLIGLGAGAALAVVGGVMQAVTRNPFASPEILGVNAGASFAVVLAIHLLGVGSPLIYVWFAFAGALGSVMLTYVIGSIGRSGATTIKLALAGAVLNALLVSWVHLILVFNQRTLDEVRFWLAGSLAGRDVTSLVQVMPFILAGLAGALLASTQLNILTLGRDVAVSLGQRVALIRGLATVIVVLLAGSAVAVAGPIGFIGLAVPHIVRPLVGPDYRWILPYSAVTGPILLLLADIVGRIVIRPGEVQAGIVTAFLGAPFLIHLARRQKLAAE